MSNIDKKEENRRKEQSRKDKAKHNNKQTQSGHHKKPKNKNKNTNHQRVPHTMIPRHDLVPRTRGRDAGSDVRKGIINSSAKLGLTKPGFGYLQTLIDNTECYSRFPDSQPRKTCLFNSVATFDIPITPDKAAGSNTGRFSCAFQPIMGSSQSPLSYQAAIAQPSTDWAATDWTSSATYAASVGGRDPRVDINTPYLAGTNPLVQSFQVTAVTGGMSQASYTPGTVASNIFIGATVTNNTNQNGSMITFNSATGLFNVPSGSWMMAATCNGTTVGGSNCYFASGYDYAGVYPAQVGLTAGESHHMYSTATAYESGVYSFFSALQPCQLGPVFTNGTPSPLAANYITAMGMDVAFVQVNNPGMAETTSANSAAISLIRPVAQTALATFIGPTIQNGGRIAAAYVTKETINDNFFANAEQGSIGNLQFVANLANLPDAYDGKVSQGAYCWWSPYDSSDWTFQTISDMNNDTWPAMVISGTCENSSSFTAPEYGYIRVRLVTTFEFITKSTAFEARIISGSQRDIDMCNKFLGQQPHAMPNGAHVGWIGDILKKVFQFFDSNADIIADSVKLGGRIIKRL